MELLNFLIWKEDEILIEREDARYLTTVLAQVGHTDPSIWAKMLNPQVEEQGSEMVSFPTTPDELEGLLKELDEAGWGPTELPQPSF